MERSKRVADCRRPHVARAGRKGLRARRLRQRAELRASLESRKRDLRGGAVRAELFCSGHIQLSDGRTLIVGGHINANEGLADTTIFNPTTKTYFRGPDMSVGRWYPTATQLPDGRVFTMAGDNIVQDRPGADHPFSDASVNSLPSVYNPRTNTWADLEGGEADIAPLSVPVRALRRPRSSTPVPTR